MKKIFLIPLAISLSFCNCKKSVVDSAKVSSIESICPENGECTIQLFKNKSLIVKTDDLGGIYYQMDESLETSVIQYQYDRKIEDGLQDGQHREEILFEINNKITALNLQDIDLQQTKMLFGRHCFCKGQAGYFKIEEGSLQLENQKKGISFDLDFKIQKVPQLFDKVKATVQ
ncbi:hypothetical protein [Flavobacterium sp.]